MSLQLPSRPEPSPPSSLGATLIVHFKRASFYIPCALLLLLRCLPREVRAEMQRYLVSRSIEWASWANENLHISAYYGKDAYQTFDLYCTTALICLAVFWMLKPRFYINVMLLLLWFPSAMLANTLYYLALPLHNELFHNRLLANAVRVFMFVLLWLIAWIAVPDRSAFSSLVPPGEDKQPEDRL